MRRVFSSFPSCIRGFDSLHPLHYAKVIAIDEIRDRVANMHQVTAAISSTTVPTPNRMPSPPRLRTAFTGLARSSPWRVVHQGAR